MRSPGNDFRWFGEGFDGFPKALPDDCVEYTIHIIDSKLSDLQKREHLRKVQHAGLKLTNELTRGFIWQREGFSLALEREAGDIFLRGRTNYGDSVEDEWLVVYILRELSKRFPQTWVRVVDSDGEFLLIEAAGVLPRWLNPEVADYRVWLNTGRLLVIGLQESEVNIDQAKSEPKSLTLGEAFSVIEQQPSAVIDLPSIQAEAFHRLQKYPKHILESLHHAFVRIPRRLAYILHQSPTSISPAIEAFYLRDPIALRPLQAQDDAELNFPPRDLVRVSTKFTKVGYAQLKSQQFDPPRAWAKAMALENNLKSQEEATSGMKLTAGFEMLVSDPQQQDRKVVREIKILLEDLETGEDSLPSDTDIRNWDMQEDDEKWLDINFEEFEKELGGKDLQSTGKKKGGEFGDKGAHENLQRIVANFERFLKDDAADAEGTEYLDDMDEDDDEDEAEENASLSDESANGSENQDISFNEDKFARIMREMMSMPSNTKATNGNPPNREQRNSVAMDGDDNQSLSENIRAIEKELQEAGALELNPTQGRENSAPLCRAIDTGSSDADRPTQSTVAEGVEAREHEDLDIDYDLAKNLLESFKTQGGASGLGSNLVGMMDAHA